MSTPVQNQQQQAQQQASYHFQEIQKIFPNLEQPHLGAMQYATKVAQNNNFDKQVCAVAGKVVHVQLNFADKLAVGQVVSLYGDKGPLSWTVEYNNDPNNTTNPYERTFTFPVPPSQMEDIMKIKAMSNGKWMNGPDVVCPLSLQGHHAIIGPITVTGWEK